MSFKFLGQSCPLCERPLQIEGDQVFCVAATCGYKYQLEPDDPLPAYEDLEGLECEDVDRLGAEGGC